MKIPLFSFLLILPQCLLAIEINLFNNKSETGKSVLEFANEAKKFVTDTMKKAEGLKADSTEV